MQNLELVEIASLLHDIQDWKYSGSETAAATTVQVCVSMLQMLCLQCMHGKLQKTTLSTFWHVSRSICSNIATHKTSRKLFWISYRVLASRYSHAFLLKAAVACCAVVMNHLASATLLLLQ
jgi:hypothetical protein